MLVKVVGETEEEIFFPPEMRLLWGQYIALELMSWWKWMFKFKFFLHLLLMTEQNFRCLTKFSNCDFPTISQTSDCSALLLPPLPNNLFSSDRKSFSSFWNPFLAQLSSTSHANLSYITYGAIPMSWIRSLTSLTAAKNATFAIFGWPKNIPVTKMQDAARPNVYSKLVLL